MTNVRGRIAFGVFELDLDSGELRKAGRLVRLRPQPFRVLAALAGRPGVALTRDELRAQIWADDTFVDYDQGLNYCVKEIRAALGDSAASPRWVETLPRRGYRFIGPIVATETATRAARIPAPQQAAFGIAFGLVVALALASLAPRR